MARQKGKVRNKRIIVLYSNEEFQQVKMLFARSMSTTISSYVRKVSLEEPVEIINRNVSFDDFIGEIVQLRKEMADIRQLPLTSEGELQLIRLQGDIQLRINQISDLCMRP
jgi:hypothetical protein